MEAALFASKAKINVFGFFFPNGAALNGPAECEEKFRKMLILAFEVNMHLLHYFFIFSLL